MPFKVKTCKCDAGACKCGCDSEVKAEPKQSEDKIENPVAKEENEEGVESEEEKEEEEEKQ